MRSFTGGSALPTGDLEDLRRNMDQRDLGVSFFAGFFASSELGDTSDSLERLVALPEGGPLEEFVALTEGRPPSEGEAYNWKGDANSGTGWRTRTLPD
jgi:hypothetical protein